MAEGPRLSRPASRACGSATFAGPSSSVVEGMCSPFSTAPTVVRKVLFLTYVVGGGSTRIDSPIALCLPPQTFEP